MNFCRIFGKGERLCSACYPEHREGGKDVAVFHKVMADLADTAWLVDFFTAHQDELNRPFWQGMTIDEAIDKVLDERDDFIDELQCIDMRQPGCEGKSLNDIFKKLHDDLYSLKWDKEQQRKAKPDFSHPFIRFYGTELEDGTLVITGGTIKLTLEMRGERYEREMENLRRVEAYIRQEKIIDVNGLLNE